MRKRRNPNAEPFSAPSGYYGLVFLMMLVHHLTVLPDLLSAYLEARRWRGKVKSG